MNPQNLHGLGVALPVVVGGLVLIYGLALLLVPPRREDESEQGAAARFMTGAHAACVVALVLLLVGMRIAGEPGGWWAALGWLVSLVIASLGLAGAARGSEVNSLRGGSGGALAAVAAALLVSRWAAGAPVALALGALTGAAVLNGAAACARFAQGREKEGAAIPELWPCMLFALATAALCAAARLGSLREGGVDYPFIPASVGLLVGAIGLTAAGGRITRGRLAACALGTAVIALPVDYLIKEAMYDNANMFSTVGAGMLCMAAVLLIAQRAAGRSEGLSAEAVGIGGACLGLAIAAAFRLGQGYGVSLAGVGALGMLPFAGALAWAGERAVGERDDAVRQGGQEAVLAGKVVMAAAAAVVLSALVRGYTGFHNIGVVDANRANTFSAVVLGAMVPFAIGALLLRGTALGLEKGRPGTALAAGLVCGGQAVWVAALSVAAPLAAGFFLRAEAVGGYLAGLALAAVLVTFLLLLGGLEAGPKAAGVGVMAGALLGGFAALMFSQAVIELQSELARAQKAKALEVVVIAVLLWLVVEAVWRGRKRG